MTICSTMKTTDPVAWASEEASFTRIRKSKPRKSSSNTAVTATRIDLDARDPTRAP